MTITITEALAEIKTIDKRIMKKREFIGTMLFRQEIIRDPHLADGGSPVVLARELQGISDLETRIVTLRRGIRAANEATEITIGTITRSIADWITWRREVAPNRQKYLGNIRQALVKMREQLKPQGMTATAPDTPQPGDVIVNFSETALAAEIEQVENILGSLDGQLSLKNATVLIRVEAE